MQTRSDTGRSGICVASLRDRPDAAIVLAIENMRKICAEHLSDRYTLEVIDIYLHPEACQQQQIIAAPTLIKVLPHPLRRIIGDLSNTEKVLIGLDLRPRSAPPEKTG